MSLQTLVFRADDPGRPALERAGWKVVARSWAAQLLAAEVDQPALRAMVGRAGPSGTVRSLTDDDVGEVLALDRATLGDYPGGSATRHEPLTAERARVGASRYAVGAFDAAGLLVAMSYCDLEGEEGEEGETAETAGTDFTVVAAECRGRGLGVAVKAESVLIGLGHGVTRFRTGGSSDNAAIIAANTTLGYRRDEEWITLGREAE